MNYVCNKLSGHLFCVVRQRLLYPYVGAGAGILRAEGLILTFPAFFFLLIIYNEYFCQ